MENNYIITVKRAEEANPEFIEENEELAKGMKASGYVLIMFNEDEEPIAESMANESPYGIANYLSKDIGTV